MRKMSIGEFPGNSRSPKPEPEAKKIESVVANPVVAQSGGLGKRLKQMFIGGDSRSVISYVIEEVLVPQIRSMIAEAATQGFERLIYGESANRRRTPSGAGPTDYRKYAQSSARPAGSQIRREHPNEPNAKLAKSRIDTLLFATRQEADVVVERMYDLIQDYQQVSVADVCSLVGWTSNHTDHKWGWTEMNGVDIRYARNGYILELPPPSTLEY